jgi:hypothetical protein
VRSSLILAALLACTGTPGQPPIADAAPPPRAAPQVFAELDADGRRAVCTRIVDKLRARCDAVFRDIDAALIARCATDHPIWGCTQVRVADHARCVSDGDPAACTALQTQSEACRVRESLARCPLVIETIVPRGPAWSAGLAVGDVLHALDGAPKSVEDSEGILAIIKRSGGRSLRLTVAAPGQPTREVAVTPTGAPLRIGVQFGPSAACTGFTPRSSAIPCSMSDPSPADD